MGCVTKVNQYRDWIIHAEKLESGTMVFWADRTFRNFFERAAYEH